MVEKKCSNCGVIKTIEAFRRRPANKDGIEGWCRACGIEYKKRYREQHKEKICAQSRAQRLKRRDECNARDRERRRQKAIAEGRIPADGSNHRKRVLKQERIWREKTKSVSKRIDRVSGIYMIRSIIKPYRIYIGSSIDVHQRQNEHMSDLRKNTHRSSKLQNHYNKYGVDDLVFIVLETCNDWELLIQEQYYLDNFNPFFNCNKIADSCLGMRHTKAAKRKMSKAQRGRIMSAETRAKMSASGKGRKKSAEWRRKIGEGNKGKKMSKEARLKSSLKRRGKKLNLSPEERERRRKQGALTAKIVNEKRKSA